jgi:hypothetical protein
MNNAYPVTLNIDYPDRKLNRLTSFFRIFVIIPIAIVLCLITSQALSSSSQPSKQLIRAIQANPEQTERLLKNAWTSGFSTGGLVFLSTVLMILFRKKYPKWWFDWNVNLTKFSARVINYFDLMTDVYPSTDEEQAVHIEISYSDAKKDIKPWMPLVKWFLAIPHYIVLGCLMIAALVVWIIVWFAILFTGKYPRSMFDFMVGVFRWYLRVLAYAFILVTDTYPPFSLE